MKIKATLTVTAEYNVLPENYPNAKTIDDMIKIDYDNIKSQPDILMDLPNATYDLVLEKI